MSPAIPRACLKYWKILARANGWKSPEGEITRFELISQHGRQVVRYGKMTYEFQDGGKTLKVFVPESQNACEPSPKGEPKQGTDKIPSGLETRHKKEEEEEGEKNE